MKPLIEHVAICILRKHNAKQKEIGRMDYAKDIESLKPKFVVSCTTEEMVYSGVASLNLEQCLYLLRLIRF